MFLLFCPHPVRFTAMLMYILLISHVGLPIVWSTSWATWWCSCCWESRWNWSTKDLKWGWFTWQASWRVSITRTVNAAKLALSIVKAAFKVLSTQTCDIKSSWSVFFLFVSVSWLSEMPLMVKRISVSSQVLCPAPSLILSVLWWALLGVFTP